MVSRSRMGRTHIHDINEKNLISKQANLILNIVIIVMCLLTIMPLWLIVSASLTENAALTRDGYRMWPSVFSTSAYTYLFKEGSVIISSYRNTIVATLAGTVLSTITVGLYAYALSRPDFKFRKFFTFFSFFTMLFGGDRKSVV